MRDLTEKPWAGEFPVDQPERCEDCGSLHNVETVTDETGMHLVCGQCLGLESK